MVRILLATSSSSTVDDASDWMKPWTKPSILTDGEKVVESKQSISQPRTIEALQRTRNRGVRPRNVIGSRLSV